MTLRIPAKLADKAHRFPESSYGATTVTLVLANGRRIENVVLGGAEWIVKIGDRRITDSTELDFSVDDIVKVRRPRRRWWRL